MSGEQEKGGPGVVYFDRDCGVCRYLLLPEVQPDKLRQGIEEIMDTDQEHYFVVVKDGLNVHVMKHEKQLVKQALAYTAS